MKTTDIEKLRQLLWEIKTLADNDEPEPFEGEPEPCFLRLKRLAGEALALLPCETCEGTGEIDWVCCDVHPCRKIVSSSCRICDFYTPGSPCPDCRSCKTCEGLGRIVVPRKIIPGVDWEPCLDCTISGGGI